VIQIDCGSEQSYFVDIFNVVGGKEHDYSLHGPPGQFEVIGGEWSAPQQRGTLAGEDVEVGEFYDDSKLGAPGYKGSYASYMGSGFQHFVNVRRHSGGETIAQWSHEKDPSSKLRIRVLDQPDQQLILGNARVSPVKHPEMLTYLIARRQGENLSSRFVSVIEPFKDQPLIAGVRRIDATTIEVERPDGARDQIRYDMNDARVSVVRHDAAGNETARFEAGGKKLARMGDVIATDAAKSRIRIRPESTAVTPEQFVGRIVHFQNDLRRTSHPIVSAAREGNDIVLTTADDLIVGRAHIDAVADDVLSTQTSLMLAPIYRGVTLASPTYEPLARVAEVANGKIRLATKIDAAKRPAVGDDLWLINVGPGDRFELPGVVDEAK
jgi:oligo-alginate lyase